jgi:hypothetical protein
MGDVWTGGLLARLFQAHHQLRSLSYTFHQKSANSPLRLIEGGYEPKHLDNDMSERIVFDDLVFEKV